MRTQIFRNNLQTYSFSVPSEWSDFWLLLGLAFACLLVSAILAKVRLGTFPVNPLYWHYWVIAETRTPPTYSPEAPRIYRPFMYFWAGSICLFVCALVVLVAIIYRSAN